MVIIQYIIVSLIWNSVQAATCGTLALSNSEPTVGDSIDIVYKPSSESVDVTRIWWKRNQNDVAVYNYKAKPPSSDDRIEERPTSDGKGGYSYKLRISHVALTDTGTYLLQCIRVATAITIKLNVLSKVVVTTFKPEFQNTQTFTSCSKCIPAVPGKRTDVICVVKSRNASKPLNIYKNSNKLEGVSDINDPHSITGTVEFVPTDKDDNTVFKCTASTDDIEDTLETSAKVYLLRKPGKPVMQNTSAIAEHSQVHIKCMSSGGRPAPKLVFMYDNIYYEHFPNVTSSVPSENTFRVESTFVKYVSRADNGKKLMCVSEQYTGTYDYSEETTLSVLFPPLTVDFVKLSQKTVDSGKTELMLKCTVGQSNPKSVIDWKGVTNVPKLPSKSRYDQVKSNNGWSLTQELKLNLTRDDNMRDIICAAKNDAFPEMNLEDHHKVHITYQPVITIEQGASIEAYEDDNVAVLCKVESNPTSAIIWYNETGSKLTEETKKTNKLYLSFGSIAVVNAGRYTCSANNGIGMTRNRTITLQVKPRSVKPNAEKSTNTRSSFSGTIAALIGAIIVVTLVAVVVIVLIIKKRRKARGINNQGTVRIHVEARKPSAHSSADEPVYNNIANIDSDKEDKDDTSAEYAVVIPKSQRKSKQPSEGTKLVESPKGRPKSVEYSTVVPKAQRQSKQVKSDKSLHVESPKGRPESVEYSTVVPKSKRQSKQVKPDKSLHVTNEGQKQGGNNDTNDLVYIELDLETTQSKKEPSVIRQESQTEYVSIDFNKKGAEYTAD